MLYIVGGPGKSGTSMMMEAIEAGGIPSVHDRYANPAGDAYPQHKTHSYEGWQSKMERDFGNDKTPNTRENQVRYLDGKVFKLPNWMLDKFFRVLPPELKVEARVVLMDRSLEELCMSRYAPHHHEMPKTWQEDLILQDRVRKVREHLHQWARKPQPQIKSVTRLWYPSVIHDPMTAFEQLVADGWPINSKRAAAIVDPAWYRNRFESVYHI